MREIQPLPNYESLEGVNLTKLPPRHLDIIFAKVVAGYRWYMNYNGSCRFLKSNKEEFMNKGIVSEKDIPSIEVAMDFDRLVPRFSESFDLIKPFLLNTRTVILHTFSGEYETEVYIRRKTENSYSIGEHVSNSLETSVMISLIEAHRKL